MLEKIKNKAISALRWSEQYTKTDMVYLAKGGFWTWLGKGTQILTGTAMAVAFANLLPKEIYGNYKYILSMAAILGAFTLNGLSASITRSVSRGFEGSLKTATKTMLKWSSLVFLGAMMAAGYYFFQGNNLLAGGMLIIALFQPLIKAGELYSSHLLGKKLFKVQGVYLITWETVQAILIISALFFTNNALVLIGILFILNTFFASYYLQQTLKKYVNNNDQERGMITFAKHLSIMDLVETAGKHADKILIFQLLGATPTAVYSFAILPSEKFSRLFRSISQVVLPKLSNKPLKDLQKTIARKAFTALFIMAIFTGLLILTLPTIFKLLFPAYIDAVKYAQLAATALIFVPELLFHQSLIAHVQKKYLYIINVSSNIIKILLLITLVPKYGILGGIYALLSFLLYRSVVKIFFFYYINVDR